MHRSSATQIRKRFIPPAAACSIVLGCILVAAAANSGAGRASAPYGQTSKSEPKAASNQTSGTEETRTLIRELESQAEVQRDQLQKTETSLRRARAILTDLERAQQPRNAISPARSSKHTFNPNDPMQGETLSQQALAEKTPWSWPVETATPEACARHFGGGYDVEIKSPDVPSLPPMVEVRKDGKTIVSWRAHIASVFLRGTDTLYYAEFSPYYSGCSIVAYHLDHGERWKTPLWGIGPLGNSMYTNRVNMKLDGNNLIVYGDESAGRYIQLLDIRTGRIVGRRRGADLKLTVPQ
jgi:hypothetical protein